MSNVKKLTRASIMTALACVLVYIASIAPSGKLALTALAGLLPAVVCLSSGNLYGIMAFLASALLAALLTPDKMCAVLYAAFFGYYPIIRGFISRVGSDVLAWILKLMVFGAVFVGLTFLGGAFLPDSFTKFGNLAAAVCLAAFVAYDICLGMLEKTYYSRIEKIIK